MKELVGIIELSNPIYCRGDVLGKYYKSQISDIEVRIFVPDLISYNPIASEVKDTMEQSQFIKNCDDDWGSLICYNQSKVNELNVGVYVYKLSMLLVLPDDKIEETKTKIFSGIDEWLNQLNEKLIMSRKGFVLSNKQKLTENWKGHSHINLFCTDEQNCVFIGQSKRFISGCINLLSNALDFETANTIFSSIDNSRKLKKEYWFHLNSILNLRSGNIDYAILESSIAIDLCISEVIINKSRGKCNLNGMTLGSKFEKLRILRGVIKKTNPQNTIVKHRNDVMHSRKNVSANECNEMITYVEKYLQKYIGDLHM